MSGRIGGLRGCVYLGGVDAAWLRPQAAEGRIKPDWVEACIGPACAPVQSSRRVNSPTSVPRQMTRAGRSPTVWKPPFSSTRREA